MSFARRWAGFLFRTSLISYRALFNWLRPPMFVGTLLVGPLMQLLFFVYLGRTTGFADDSFFVVGNGFLVCTSAALYGPIMAIANEREFGTLPLVLATPSRPVIVLVSRGLPYVANGLFVSIFVLATAAVVFPDALSWSELSQVIGPLLVSVVSCCAFGLAIGALALRVRDVFVLANMAFFLLLVLSGANLPVSALPGWAQTLAVGIPLRNGLAAARGVLEGEQLSVIVRHICLEGAVAVAYAAGSALLLTAFYHRARRAASLDLY
jgi:ABC-2 type transport system permease protein